MERTRYENGYLVVPESVGEDDEGYPIFVDVRYTEGEGDYE